MTLMVTGNAGFTGAAAPTGPNAGYDPVMKFSNCDFLDLYQDR